MKLITAFTLLLMTISNVSSAATGPDYENGILKVCADPYMLPFSNQEGEGYENKIAELMADKLGMELQYEFFPQRMGFIRNSLKKENDSGGYNCDLVITVPEKFELASATDAYYTTTYSLAYVKGRNLDGLTDPEDLKDMVEKNNIDLKFGISDRGPQQLWLFYQNLMQYMKTYQGQPGDIKVHPGQKMMEALAKGDIDATIVWGPTAAYYAREYKDQAEIVLLPIKNLKENAEGRFEYSMSMAVRYGEKEWKEKIQKTINENIDGIHAILNEYGVPLIERTTPKQTDEDDDD